MKRLDALPEFQRYQLAFSAHLRDPQQPFKPGDVPAARMAVYEEIVFNNLLQSITACFPIAEQKLGHDRWLTLVRSFMQQHSANSPLFREIPEEFLHYLSQQVQSEPNVFPRYLYSLCHYEWVELAVASAPDTVETDKVNALGDVLNEEIVFAPGLQLLRYDFAVHRLSAGQSIDAVDTLEPAETFLAVYRNPSDEVKFIELNAVTYRLLMLLQTPMCGTLALEQVARELGYADAGPILNFGREILEDLKQQQLISGTSRA